MRLVQIARHAAGAESLGFQEKRDLREIIAHRGIVRHDRDQPRKRAVKPGRVALLRVITIKRLQRFALRVAIFRQHPEHRGPFLRPVPLEGDGLQQIQAGRISVGRADRRHPVFFKPHVVARLARGFGEEGAPDRFAPFPRAALQHRLERRPIAQAHIGIGQRETERDAAQHFRRQPLAPVDREQGEPVAVHPVDQLDRFVG